MKHYPLSISGMTVILGMLNQFVYANLPTTINQYPIIKGQIHKEPLMISHLPENMAKRLSLSAPLTYASGHEFNDASIELLDENGKKIIYKHQIDPKQNYALVSTGQAAQIVKNIWFFSPNGSDQVFEDDFDLNKCTAENPCKQLTQQLIDGIHNRSPNAKLWFATGTYNLPYVVQQKLNPQLLELHNDQNIMGRTSDFRHFAYGKDRPLLLGTLSWNDYTYHGGVSASVENISMHTSNNRAQVGDTFVNTNLHSTGHLSIANCSFENSSDQYGTNIFAQNINVYQSSLKGQGVRFENIYSEEEVIVQQSILKVKGSDISNLIIDSGFLLAINSRFTVENDSCSGYAIQSGSPDIYLESVKLSIRSDRECTTPFITSAILANASDSSFMVNNSTIKVFSKFGAAAGILNMGSKISLNNSKIKVQSLQNSAIGIGSGNIVEFIDKPSFLIVSSPVSADPFYKMISSLKLFNNSTPRSQCLINDGEMHDCQLP